MGIVNALTSPFTVSIFITMIVTFPLPLILNYIFQHIPKFFFQFVALSIFIVTAFMGFFISIYTSNSYCKKIRFMKSFKKGLTQAFYTTLVYLIVFMIPFFKTPFTDIGQDTLLWNSLAEGFFVGLTSITLTISTYFTSQKDCCVLTKEEANKQYKKIEKGLKSRKKKSVSKKVEIKT